MSLKALNDDFQVELQQTTTKSRMPLSGAFRKLRGNSIGSLLRGAYPDSQRLEELLGE